MATANDGEASRAADRRDGAWRGTALKPLVGEWRLVATFKDMPPADVGARVTFEWLPGERFLIQRWEVPIPEAPDGIAIIGPDPERESKFSQRHTGTFSDDGKTIAGAWEICHDGKTWEHDSDLTYTKA